MNLTPWLDFLLFFPMIATEHHGKEKRRKKEGVSKNKAQV
jgi:hypothetical protein